MRFISAVSPGGKWLGKGLVGLGRVRLLGSAAWSTHLRVATSPHAIQERFHANASDPRGPYLYLYDYTRQVSTRTGHELPPSHVRSSLSNPARSLVSHMGEKLRGPSRLGRPRRVPPFHGRMLHLGAVEGWGLAAGRPPPDGERAMGRCTPEQDRCANERRKKTRAVRTRAGLHSILCMRPAAPSTPLPRQKREQYNTRAVKPTAPLRPPPPRSCMYS